MAGGNGLSLRLNGTLHSRVHFPRPGMSGTELLRLTWLRLGSLFPKTSSPGEVTKGPTNLLGKDKLRKVVEAHLQFCRGKLSDTLIYARP